MAISKTTNPEMTAPVAKMHPGDTFKAVCTSFVAARNAAIRAAYSVTVHLFIVNHFRDANDKEYRSVKDATAYIVEQLPLQTDVKSGMLDRYIRVGADLYSRLKDNKFADLHAKLSKADKADKAIEIVADYMKARKDVDTFADLMRALGHSTGHDAPAPAASNPEERVANVGKNVTQLVKALQEKSHKTASTANRLVAQQVAAALDPFTLAKQALQRITDLDELLDLAKLVETLADKLSADAEKAEKAAKSAAKAPRKAATKAKAKIEGAQA
jgi:hypothetical protein